MLGKLVQWSLSVVLVASIFLVGSEEAEAALIYGPQSVATHPNPNQIKVINLNATPGTYELSLKNGVGEKESFKVNVAEIKLNGTVIVSSSQFNHNTASVKVPVSLSATNRIEIKLRGGTTSYVEISINSVGPAPNVVPVADFSSSISARTVSFNASTSYDIDGSIVNYAWDFGDGTTGTGLLTTHTYATSGSFNAILTVTDNSGATSVKSRSIVIAPNISPLANFTAQVTNLDVQFDAASSSDPDGTIINYRWEFGDGAVGEGARVAHSYTLPGTYLVKLTVTDNFGGVASKTLSVSPTTPNTMPIANITVNRLQGEAPLMLIFDSSASSDSDGTIVSRVWNFGDGKSSSEEVIPHEFVNSGTYEVSLTVTDNLGGTHVTTVTITASTPPVSPDPVALAPPLSTEQITPFDEMVSFIYSGPNPIQKNVYPDKIEERRVVVIRGKILDENNSPLAGVEVTDPTDSGYGFTHSRSDGMFEFATNGGGVINLNFKRSGYFPVQRKVKPEYNEFQYLTDIIMLRPDEIVSVIDSNSSEAQVAQGSVTVDSRGTRTSTIIVPSSTEAALVMPNGSIRNVDQINLRMTEYTIGDAGPKRMPAELPRTSSYTYAIEVSADEALALGAEHIQFSKPVAFYVDNFLNFNVGVAVPMGVYDRAKQAWIPQDNGRVIKILSLENGKAILDVVGQNIPASASELQSLGIDDQELTKLASLYPANKSLWRVTSSRFSAIDLNWATGDLKDSAPNVKDPSQLSNEQPRGGLDCRPGSIVVVDTLTLGESIPLKGTPFTLNYWSDRMPGRITERSLDIQLTKPTVLPGLKSVRVDVSVAGKNEVFNFGPAANQNFTYVWNGKDFAEREVHGKTPVLVKISYIYDTPYLLSQPSSERLFSTPGLTAQTTVSAAGTETSLSAEFDKTLGTKVQALLQSIGGWTLDVHHSYDPVSKTLYMGNGRKIAASSLGTKVRTIAGTGITGFSGDNGPAQNARLASPFNVTILRDGSLIVTDTGRLRKIDSSGIIRTIAGGGSAVGEGVLATSAFLNGPGQVAEAPDGALYFSEFFTHKIKKITLDGRLYTVAGTGVGGYNGDGGPAINSQINFPRGVTIAPDGSFYFGDSNNHRIRYVSTDGIMHSIAGTGISGYAGDNGPALEAKLNSPTLIGLDSNGSIYVAEYLNSIIRKISPSGMITTVAGVPGVFSYNGDDQDALLTHLNAPYCATVDRDGSIYICDSINNRIRRVATNGIVSTIAGTGVRGYNGENRMGSQTQIGEVQSVAIGKNGEVYFNDFTNHRIRVIEPVYPSSADSFIIASEDGSEVFSFDSTGRHINTRYARTGEIKYNFEYDQENALVGVLDSYGGRTQIVRSNRKPTSIVSPDGLATAMSVDSSNLINDLRSPGNENYLFDYYAGSLLRTFTNPRGAVSTFLYDQVGRLIEDKDALNGSLKFAVAALDDLNITDAEGRISRNVRASTWSGSSQKTYGKGILQPTHTTTYSYGLSTQINSASLISEARLSEDPRLGPDVQFPRSTAVRTPAGVINNSQISKSITRQSVGNLFDYAETTAINSNGRVSQSSFDSANGLTINRSPLNRQSYSIINRSEQVVEDGIGGLAPSTFQYDERGRLARLTTGSRENFYAYNSDGYLSSTKNAIGLTTLYFYDGAGRMNEARLPDGQSIFYQYDSSGNLASLTPAGRSPHLMIYDLVDSLISYDPPNLPDGPASTTYNYNLDKQITKLTRPDGQIATYAYHPSMGKIQTISSPQGNYTYTYQSNSGLLSSVASPTHTMSYLYDGGLPIRITSSTGLMNLTYEAGFRLKTQSLAGAVLTYSYDNDNLLTQIGAMNLVYKTQNPLLESTGLLSSSDFYNYSAFGELNSYSAQYAGTSVLDASYSRDNLGRIISKTESFDGTTSDYEYGYDVSGRLASVKKDGAFVSQYNYDVNGNRLMSSVRGTPVSPTYDSQDRLISSGSKNYFYNRNGDLQSVVEIATGLTTQYEYGVFGELRRVILPSGVQVNYQVDGLRRRSAKRIGVTLVASYFYDQEGRIISDGNTRYVYASKPNTPDYMIRSGITYRIFSDERGSVRIVQSASTGAVMQKMNYDEFGRVLSDTNPGFQPFGFAGGLYDSETKLVRFGARDYDPETGRWLSKDPILFGGGDTNLYGYVMNDPINFIDPTGLYWFRQDWQTPGVVGRPLTSVPPEGALSEFIERYVPASYTFGENHDAFVDWANSNGVPDWLSNIPSMIPSYVYSVGQEVLRSGGLINQPTQQGLMCK